MLRVVSVLYQVLLLAFVAGWTFFYLQTPGQYSPLFIFTPFIFFTTLSVSAQVFFPIHRNMGFNQPARTVIFEIFMMTVIFTFFSFVLPFMESYVRLYSWQKGAEAINTLPQLAQCLLALALGDLGRYAHHRAVHTFPFFWRFHKFHHFLTSLSVRRAYSITVTDIILSETLGVAMLFLLGFDTVDVGWAIILAGGLQNVAHQNSRIDYGFLNRYMPLTKFHYYHHDSRINKNFSTGVTVLWDHVFGSYHENDKEKLSEIPLGVWAETARKEKSIEVNFRNWLRTHFLD